MTEQKLEALVAALLADPPTTIDTDALSAADRDELSAALRAAVADLPATEQRTRLAAAFRAMSTPEPDPVADLPPTPVLASTPSPDATTRYRFAGAFNLVGAGIAVGLLVIAVVAGALVGVATDGDDAATSSVPAAAEDPVPLLDPVSTGDTPPTADFLDQLRPPDAEAQAAAVRAQLEADPDLADELTDIDGADDIDAADFEGTSDAAAEPVAGYVDSSVAFGGSTPSGPGDGDSGDGYSGDGDSGDGDSGDGTGEDGPGDTAGDTGGESGDESGDGVGGGTPGDGGGVPAGAGDDPAVIDRCASDEPPPDCEGVGGTVTLALETPFRFYTGDPAIPPALWTTHWPGCVSEGGLRPGDELPRDQMVFYMATNNLGDFTVRYRVEGSGDEFTELTTSSPEIWRTTVEERPFVGTCAVAERSDEGAFDLEVHITGVGDGDSGTDEWTGTLHAPALEELPTGRPGRPPVRVDAITASDLEVIVPAKPNETVQLSVRRTGAGLTGTECGDLPYWEERAIEDITLLDDGGDWPDEGDDGGSGITLMPDWVEQRFAVSVPEIGHYAICAYWFDTFDPPRQVEQSATLVRIEGLAGGELLLAGVHAYGDTTPDEVGVSGHFVTSGEADSECGSDTLAGDALAVDEESPGVLCTFPGSTHHLGVTVRATFGGDVVERRVTLPVPTSCAPDDAVGATGPCTQWHSILFRDPSGMVVGAVVVGVRLGEGSGPDSVTVNDEEPLFNPDPDYDGPRLLWDQVTAEPDPIDPSRRVIVRWKTDVPDVDLRIRLTAETGSGREFCHQTISPPTSGTEGGITFRNLCPGVEYLVSFDLRNEDGRAIYGYGFPDVRVGPRGVINDALALFVRTERMDVIVDYDLEFEALDGSGPIASFPVVPRYLNMGFHGGLDHDDVSVLAFTQYYNGTAYIELDCADLGHYERSGSGLRLDIGGGAFYQFNAQFGLSRYDPAALSPFQDDGFQCPNFDNQVYRTRSEFGLCGIYLSGLSAIGDSNNIRRMLAGNEAVFRDETAVTDSCSADPDVRLRATLRVRMRRA